VWLGLRRRTSRKKVNKAIKCGVQISGALKCKRVTNTVGKVVMLGVMSKLVVELELSSLTVSQAVGCARRRGDKVTKVRMERVIGEGNEDIWTEARSRTTLRIILEQNGRCIGAKRVELMHPSRRFSEFVS
jgi:hypothetical protein